MDDPAYQRELSAHRRMPWETAILAMSLVSLGISFAGVLSVVFYALSIAMALFWLMITFNYAKEPRYPQGFALLEPVVHVALFLTLGGLLILTWVNAGFSDAVILLFQMSLVGIVVTAIITWLVRLFT